MSTCKTCAHWGKDDLGRYSQAWRAIRRCEYVLPFFDCRGWTEDGEDVITNDRMAFAQDGSDYSAELLTKPDFGCNQWKAEE